jgi:DNA-binding response OmpR family regulator
MCRILVVDDNKDILEAVSLVLSRKEMDVATLNDPAFLHDYISKYAPDLLLMDIAMGSYDGRLLCREIKTSPDKQQLPVVLFSARSYSAESIRNSQADDMIAKPFCVSELCDIVHRLLPQAW